MASATRVACNEEGKGDGGKSDGDEGGGQATATRAMATALTMMWAMVMAMRLAGNKEGKGRAWQGQ